jgi:CHASE2 domain-containing sensor protein
MIILGVSYSIYTFNGIRTFSQVLEILIIFGYLVSNYLLAKRNPFAWLVFVVGLGSMSLLMFIQGKPILCIQQIISLIPVIIGFIKVMKKQNRK